MDYQHVGREYQDGEKVNQEWEVERQGVKKRGTISKRKPRYG